MEVVKLFFSLSLKRGLVVDCIPVLFFVLKVFIGYNKNIIQMQKN